MGADYDMGSNSRSASGKEGNAGAAMGAEVKYVTQQSSIKANAAAAYQGGETVKLQGGIDGRVAKPGGTVATAGTTTTTYVAAEAQYKVVKKSQARAGFEMDSDKAGVIAVGTVVDALERKINDKGIVRVRFNQGWISEKTGAGVPCLELIIGSSLSAAESSCRLRSSCRDRICSLFQDLLSAAGLPRSFRL